jgi:hypothetical protein
MKLNEALANKRGGGADQAQFNAAFNRFVKEIVKYAKAKAHEDIFDRGHDYGGESPEDDLPSAEVNIAISQVLSLSERLMDAVKEKIAKTPGSKYDWESMLSDMYRDMSRSR